MASGPKNQPVPRFEPGDVLSVPERPTQARPALGYRFASSSSAWTLEYADSPTISKVPGRRRFASSMQARVCLPIDPVAPRTTILFVWSICVIALKEQGKNPLSAKQRQRLAKKKASCRMNQVYHLFLAQSYLSLLRLQIFLERFPQDLLQLQKSTCLIPAKALSILSRNLPREKEESQDASYERTQNSAYKALKTLVGTDCRDISMLTKYVT